ncbi:MAG: hypothetical protein A2V69_02145 [Candidatus Portnoybacteria bacterium RBG_13_40_8]|uniref:Uncharacterized protein n=1 Tax=Candidatus Portnoybacteria bacterium RBG_13_40_8 TaxID=1801990 RepID=A0A1G2F3R1_9BACT|nr:MAG: hypothetical protein A2V69_02145 [Candidatus Portnoybacteria bacterium RBG_13_40_8]OGZ34805.1 MAG: hypothetical protein A2V60_00635 [Candidatus Portnoybacteria bacterium RIFCSPHIGHO2_01_FULL_39_19]
MLSRRKLRPRLGKYDLAYQKEKGGEWTIKTVWATCQAEVEVALRRKTGIDLSKVNDYAFLSP